jgi:putative endonuclease
MAEHNELGKWEEMAVEFLRKDGYTILQLHFSKAEIDILAQRKHTCCCRSQNAFFFGIWIASDFVKPKKSSFLLKLLMPL